MSLAFSPAGIAGPTSITRSANGAVAAGSGEAAAPVVRLTAVKKRFGQFAAIDGISFSVAHGEILGIIGRSGAGKSTLIRCLNGLERPDEGDVEILGQSLGTLPEAALRRVRGRIGMIFQHFNLLSSKTAAENVALPLKIAGVSHAKRAERVADLLRLVGLDTKAAAYPAQLSGGQKQRVGIARALAAEPALLLSDEATSALDPETTTSILELLREINRQLGLTIVMITHEMSVVRAVTERVIVLDHGRIVEEGLTRQVFASPKTELTRRLIGSSTYSPDVIAAERLEPTFRHGLHAILRLTIEGTEAARPILGDLTRASGVEPLILQAGIERVGADPVARLVLAVPNGDPARIAALRTTLNQRVSDFEVVGYAQHPL